MSTDTPDRPGPIEREGIRQFCGKQDASGMRIGMACSRFNRRFTDNLVRAALDALAAMGADRDAVDLAWVPGAYEVPSALARMEALRPADGYLALGLVMQGATRHAETIDQAVGRSLLELSLSWGKPVIHEVVSVYNEEQAEQRCLAGPGSRGWYAAEAVVEMVRLFRALGEAPT